MCAQWFAPLSVAARLRGLIERPGARNVVSVAADCSGRLNLGFSLPTWEPSANNERIDEESAKFLRVRKSGLNEVV